METESKTYPKILRSRKEKKIFFPSNIQQVEKEKEIFYHYDLVKIPDTGQQIEDYELFKKENYIALRKNAYGDWRTQFEIMQEQGFTAWQDYCGQIKTEYPKGSK